MTTDAPPTRRLFSYLGGEEWAEYRAILEVFANTFFSEFPPVDVHLRLSARGVNLPNDTVVSRLDSLVGWGNLTVSSSVGNPTSLDDYYRKRNRYLITRAGQEVHALVEDVLTRVDEVRDVSTGRLRAVRDALTTLGELNVDTADPARLADAVRQVFDPHIAFTNEITQFFTAINQWQSRYDLDPDEFNFFAEVLVGYVGDRINEIERVARPIGRLLAALAGRTELIAGRVTGELAERVDRAGLAGTVSVTRAAGSRASDWEHLAGWFVSTPSRPSRLEELTRQAIAAVRTLTMNLTRLSRVGVGASSRRADFLRLAGFVDEPGADIHRLAAAAFGLYSPSHFGVLAEDADDPVHPTTSWWEAPRAVVAVSIRTRGDATNRGRPTPLRDRSTEVEQVRARRRRQLEAHRRVDAELLDLGHLDGAYLSMAALARLQKLLDKTTHRQPANRIERRAVDGSVGCVVRPIPGGATRLTCPEGSLTLADISVEIIPGDDHA